ncbi:hypothetical protein [Maribacter luteus]|uniref:DUF4238 domain-containing protein n=1 Tax=Maribacter luteus TaxID=2594478 RepID=A0A6I2MKH3_9FLAO|nr:hypothetical protein [Maribacter luteus]MRX63582.1 hypothetical protein [Maribacter luteus]
MKNCQLCKINVADKKGSHIVPHFLLKRILNDLGEKGRDKEVAFILKKDVTTSHFGRAVQPEKLKEIYGEVTEDLIENNTDDAIVDNYFCTNCEKRFGTIESEYAKTLTQSTSTKSNYISEKRPFLCFLFWASIIWRLSIQEESGFKLKQKEENKLGRILNKYLKLESDQIQPDSLDSDLLNIGYKLLRAPNFSQKKGTWLHWSPTYERPYSLIIDEYLLFFYFKKNHLKGISLNFYNTEQFKKKAYFNTCFSSESIYGIEPQDYEKVTEELMKYAVHTRLDTLSRYLDEIHQLLGGKGKHMNPNLKQTIIKRITDSDKPLGHSQTRETYIEIIIRTIKEWKYT